MGEAEEEISIPTETQGFTALRRLGLVVFLAAAFLVVSMALFIQMGG